MILLDRDRAATAAPTAADASTTVSELRPAYCLLGAPLAGVIAGVALAIAAADGPSAEEIVRPILVVLWAGAGLLLGLRRRRERLAPIVLGGAIVGAVGTLAAAMLAHRDLDGSAQLAWDVALRFATALLPAVALHLLLALVDGRLATPIRRSTVLGGYITGCLIGVGLLANREHVLVWPMACAGSPPSASACTPATAAT